MQVSGRRPRPRTVGVIAGFPRTATDKRAPALLATRVAVIPDASAVGGLKNKSTVPPLTLMFCAVTQLAASPARNATTAAISAGWPRRRKGLIASTLARNCWLLPIR